MVEQSTGPREEAEIWADRFQIRRVLGTGALGKVYEAYDRQRRERVALKTLRSLNPEALFHLKREFRALREIEHPHLVRFGDLVCDHGRWFFSMELIEGRDLLSHLRPPDGRGELHEAGLRDALGQLVQGLRALHGFGLVHRDVKPSNILVTPHSRVVLLDFGMAMWHIDHKREPPPRNTLAGTVLFMSPEQADSQPVGPPSDWYNLGVLLYHLFSGTYPFDGNPVEILKLKTTVDPEPIHRRAPDIPEDLGHLCMELLHRDPSRRPTGQDIAACLGLDGEEPRVLISHRTDVETRAPADPFVGRRQEIQTLRQELSASLDELRILSIQGAPGVGKSLLAHRFLATHGAEHLVLAGRCYSREAVPYNGFDGVIDDLSHSLKRWALDNPLPALTDPYPLSRLFPVLQRVPGLFPEHPTDDSRPPRERAFEALAELLNHVAHRTPLLIFIDDWHWADPESRALLQALRAHLPSAPILFLLTERPHEEALFSGPATTVLELQNLSEIDTRALIDAVWPLPEPLDDAHLNRLLDETEGHPMLLRELVRSWSTDTALRSQRGLHLPEVIRERFRRLSPGEQELLEILAISELPLDFDSLQAALRRDRPAILGRAERMHIEGLVQEEGPLEHPRLRLYHSRIRESLLATMSPDRARHLHDRLADAYLQQLAGGAANPLALVDHLDAAGRHDEAVQIALRTAQSAEDSFAFHRAAGLYARILRWATDDTLTREVATRRAEALLSAGLCGEAAEAFLQIDDSRQARHKAAEALLLDGQIHRGVALLTEILADCGLKVPSSRPGLLVFAATHRLKLRRRGLDFQPVPIDDIDPEALDRWQVMATAGRQLAYLDPGLGFAFRPATLKVALDLGHRPGALESFALEAVAESAREGERSTPTVDALLMKADQMASTPGERAVIMGCRASCSVFQGRTARAVDELFAAEDLMDRHGRGSQRTSGTNRVQVWQAKCLLDLGRLSRLRPLLERLLRRAHDQGNLLQLVALHRIAGPLWLLDDHPDRLARALATSPLFTPILTRSVLHLYDARTPAELAIYSGTVQASFDELHHGLLQMSSSLLGRRSRMARAEISWSLGRLHLALLDEDPSASSASSTLRKARRIAGSLHREKHFELATLYAHLLSAAIAHRPRATNSSRNQALNHLDRAAEIALRRGNLLYHACALYHRGLLADGTPHPDALAFFSEEAVPNPRRAAQTYAPGLLDKTPA